MKTFLITTFLISTISYANSQEVKPVASSEAVNTTCTKEAETAKCGNKDVGSGLLKCLYTYKKNNKDFKISDVCKASLKQLKTDKQNDIK